MQNHLFMKPEPCDFSLKGWIFRYIGQALDIWTNPFNPSWAHFGDMAYTGQAVAELDFTEAGHRRQKLLNCSIYSRADLWWNEVLGFRQGNIFY